MTEQRRLRVHPAHGDERAARRCATSPSAILDGDAAARGREPRVRATVDDADPAARRQLADLPRVLRAADRHGHGVSGQVTNAVFGFTSMLINLLQGPPARRASLVAFDRPEPTFRHEADRDLQGQPRRGARHPAPADGPRPPGARRAGDRRSSSWPASRPTTSSPRSPTRPRDRGDDVIIVTGDRDAYQLVEDPHVKVLYNRRGVSATTRSTTRPASSSAPASRRRSTRSTPRCAATRPTTCPACPGVGEKTAAKLITTYGGLDGIFAHLDEQTPKLRPEPRRARGPGPQERSR